MPQKLFISEFIMWYEIAFWHLKLIVNTKYQYNTCTLKIIKEQIKKKCHIDKNVCVYTCPPYYSFTM